MIGVMVLTSFDMLSEHDLFKPNSDIKNLNILCLMLLDFLAEEATDLDSEWGCEVVRLCDEAGIELEKDVRKQLSVTEEQLKDLRELYVEKQQSSEYDQEGELGEGNGYKAFARMENWTPDDDIGEGDEGKLWYRWDWELEVRSYSFILIVKC
jgi:hypothetical protein